MSLFIYERENEIMSRDAILIVDDDKIIREAFRLAFDEFRIIAASNGEEALAILRRPNSIGIAVLDVMMPGMKGTELLREIKKLQPDCKVAMLTGCGIKDVIIEALRGNADDFIEKPFDAEETRGILARLMSEVNSGQTGRHPQGDEKICRAQKFIEQNFNKELSLKDIAAELCLSPKYLSRLFKEKSGRSFSEYKIGIRMRKAKELLRAGAYTVGQIAYKVGYQTPDAFMRAFKRMTGLRPSGYRAAGTPAPAITRRRIDEASGRRRR